MHITAKKNSETKIISTTCKTSDEGILSFTKHQNQVKKPQNKKLACAEKIKIKCRKEVFF
jgi:hypothetical protein